MAVLDLGCGAGTTLSECGVGPSDTIVGADLQLDRLKVAAANFPSRKFVNAAGENLPFRDQVFESFICRLALPYMNIPVTLAEAHRVLIPGGCVHLTLHALRFTVHELAVAFPKPKPLLFRFWVILNGLILHFKGKPASVFGRFESFQTRRGISLALRKAGFVDIVFSRPPGRFGRMLIVEARKPSADRANSQL